MVSSVTALSSLNAASAPQSTAVAHGAPHKTSSPQDSVHLSPAALAAAGDVDHDGDSH